MAEVVIEGLRELKIALEKLPQKIAGRVLLAATMAGAEIIRKQAVANAPEDTGKLKRNIVKRRSRKTTTQRAVVEVAWRTMKGRMVNGKKTAGKDDPKDAFYGRHVEFGTSKMAARPFLVPAFEQKKEDAVNAIKDRLAKRIEKEAQKLVRRRL